MSVDEAVTDHYGRDGLWRDIDAALRKAGKDPDSLTVEDLAPLDHFHGRGVEATEEMAEFLDIRAEHRVLDVGCGIGGPARFFAARTGCRVVGVDLTEEFCRVAEELTRRVGLGERVAVHHASALAMPFEADAFDRAYSQNVLMNVSDKAAFFREVHRVLKPGGIFAATELVTGPGGAPHYPVPWAETPATSFLCTLEESKGHMTAAGLIVERLVDTGAAALAHYRRVRERMAREGPPVLSPHILMGARAKERMSNTARNIEENRVVPILAVCRKP